MYRHNIEAEFGKIKAVLVRKVLPVNEKILETCKESTAQGRFCSVNNDWIVELIDGYILRALVCHTSLEEGFEEQLKDVKQEMFLGNLFYIRVKSTIKGKHLKRYSKSLGSHDREIKFWVSNC